MVGRGSAEERLAYLRELILNARAMPMSASCVINRDEVLAAIDDVIEICQMKSPMHSKSSTRRHPRLPKAKKRQAGSWLRREITPPTSRSTAK